jgi:hypothetical protein
VTQFYFGKIYGTTMCWSWAFPSYTLMPKMIRCLSSRSFSLTTFRIISNFLYLKWPMSNIVSSWYYCSPYQPRLEMTSGPISREIGSFQSKRLIPIWWDPTRFILLLNGFGNLVLKWSKKYSSDFSCKIGWTPVACYKEEIWCWIHTHGNCVSIKG